VTHGAGGRGGNLPIRVGPRTRSRRAVHPVRAGAGGRAQEERAPEDGRREDGRRKSGRREDGRRKSGRRKSGRREDGRRKDGRRESGRGGVLSWGMQVLACAGWRLARIGLISREIVPSHFLRR